MAHVLLPCDLPSWTDVRKLMSGVRSCGSGAEAALIMAQVHEACSVSLDPEDSAPIRGHPGFPKVGPFLDPHLNTVADIAEWAARLDTLTPPGGIRYSLAQEEVTLTLDRRFVASLLANAFFSTFPRRKNKTHPTLQDFNMADFFTYLDREGHQRRLNAFFRYFEGLEPEPDGTIRFIRKLFRGATLPSWLCSEQPLVPLLVRPQGSEEEAEPWVFRGCSCAASVGGNVLTESTSQESCLFFECPELLSGLCFLECLVEEEALIVEGVRTPNTQEVNYCFVVSESEGAMIDDRRLLQSLNKAVAAFAHEPRFVDRRSTPDGGESSEESSVGERSASDFLRPLSECPKTAKKLEDKSLSQASSKYSESCSRLDEEYYTADEHSESVDECSSSSAPPVSSSCSGGGSLRSMGFVLHQRSSDDEEDEDMPGGPRYERLEDFRRRIRRRTRSRKAERRRRRRRGSSLGGGGGGNSSSDMEDIEEEEGGGSAPVLITVRPACSEPSLLNLPDSATEIPRWVSPEALLSVSGQKHLMATCMGGVQLKAYSHDGVRPNLPVPFKAKFRVKKKRSAEGISLDDDIGSNTEDKEEWMSSRCPVAVSVINNEDPQLRVLVLWLAASMAQVPALILYTMNEPALKEVIRVYKQVLVRQWSVGDLACEVLRFCRNRIAPNHRTGKYDNVFDQLMADGKGKIFTEESLD